MSDAPDFYNMIAVERGCPADWRWNQFEVLGLNMKTGYVPPREHGAMKVVGAVCNVVYKSGKNKGKPNWSKRTHEATLVIMCRDYDERKLKWGADTGRCCECGGSGREVKSCGVDGKTYRSSRAVARFGS